ncbi:hypothetical protein PFISCL1PPCAC_28658, partial [Pristionchus fissidentatus]
FSLFFLGCPTLQVITILALDSVSFRQLREWNAQISDIVATNRNVEWRLVCQSLCSCLPNLLWIFTYFVSPSLDLTSGAMAFLATTGVRLFDVILDGLVIIVFNKPTYNYARPHGARSSSSHS